MKKLKFLFFTKEELQNKSKDAKAEIIQYTKDFQDFINNYLKDLVDARQLKK